MADLIYRRDAYDVVYKEHCGICTGAILDIPKVDAIPIEWLKELIKNGHGNICNCAEMVLVRWRNENAPN